MDSGVLRYEPSVPMHLDHRGRWVKAADYEHLRAELVQAREDLERATRLVREANEVIEAKDLHIKELEGRKGIIELQEQLDEANDRIEDEQATGQKRRLIYIGAQSRVVDRLVADEIKRLDTALGQMQRAHAAEVRVNAKRLAEIMRLEKRLTIEGDHPFPEGYDALDLMADREKSLRSENDALKARHEAYRQMAIDLIEMIREENEVEVEDDE